MSDIVFVLIVLVFFALAALFVRACDRIIGPDEDLTDQSEAADPSQRAAA